MKTRSWLYAVVLFFAAVLAWWPSVRSEFVLIDDRDYAFGNMHIREGLTAHSAAWAFRDVGYAANWHPLTWMSLAADVSVTRRLAAIGTPFARDEEVWAPRDGPFARVTHLHNLLLHAANTVLLFLLLYALCGSRSAGGLMLAALLSLLWALHPLRCEAVCWISERKELLSTFFMLLSLLFYFRDSGPDAGAALDRPRCASLFFFLLALLSKPMAVSLPAVFLAWDLFVRRRVRWIPVIVAGVMSLAVCVLTLAAQTKVIEIAAATPFQRVLMTLNAPVVYLRQTFWPVGLSVFYPVPPPPYWIESALGVVLLAAVVWAAVRWWRRRDAVSALVLFAAAWYLVALLPVSGIVKVGYQPHSDRYTYWPFIGLFVTAVLAIRSIAPRVPSDLRSLAFKAAAAAAVCLVFVLRPQIGVWRDAASLFGATPPENIPSEIAVILSRELKFLGEKAVAQAVLREAVSRTKDAGASAELALLLAQETESSPWSGRNGPDPAFAESRLLARGAIAADPASVAAYEALALCAARENRWQDALRVLEAGLAAVPEKHRPRFREKIRACKSNL